MDYPLERTVDDAPKICIRRIKAGSLFKLVAIGVFSVMVPLFVFIGVLVLMCLLGCENFAGRCCAISHNSR